eukprot:4118188-Lingulodinium_polyedra.AAC.1
MTTASRARFRLPEATDLKTSAPASGAATGKTSACEALARKPRPIRGRRNRTAASPAWGWPRPNWRRAGR